MPRSWLGGVRGAGGRLSPWRGAAVIVAGVPICGRRRDIAQAGMRRRHDHHDPVRRTGRRRRRSCASYANSPTMSARRTRSSRPRRCWRRRCSPSRRGRGGDRGGGRQAVGSRCSSTISRPGPGGAGCIWRTCTSPPQRADRGSARRCSSISRGIAVERDCARFEWAVLDWNTPAIGFYRSIGAGTLEEWTIKRVTGEALERLAEGG